MKDRDMGLSLRMETLKDRGYVRLCNTIYRSSTRRLAPAPAPAAPQCRIMWLSIHAILMVMDLEGDDCLSQVILI